MYKRYLDATAYEDVPEYNTIAISLDAPHAWERVSTFTRNLLEAGYDVVTFIEGGVTYIIEFNPSADFGYGNEVLAWVTPEERETLTNGRFHEVQAETVAPQTICVPCGSDFAVKDESKN